MFQSAALPMGQRVSQFVLHATCPRPAFNSEFWGSGPATRLTITVKTPATAHELPVGKIEAWLQSSGKSPSEQVLKERLKKLLSP